MFDRCGPDESVSSSHDQVICALQQHKNKQPQKKQINLIQGKKTFIQEMKKSL